MLDIIETGDPFLKSIVTKGKDVIGVAHLGRRPNTYQRSALDWLYPTCAAQGCGVRSSFLQTDHREDWAQTHVTVFELLDRLCRRHHGLKTNEGWRLVEGKGKRPFVPPDDPRHPGPSPHSGRAGPSGSSTPAPGPAPVVPSGATAPPSSAAPPSSTAPTPPSPAGPQSPQRTTPTSELAEHARNGSQYKLL